MTLLLADTLPVDLETLDADDNVIASVAATLNQLDGEAATLSLPEEEPMRGLYWGARVRFWIGDGPQGYEVTGVVAGHSRTEMGTEIGTEAEAETESAARELLVRVWECRNTPHRRATPRRRGRFAVQLFPLSSSDNGLSPFKKEWLRGWCVDIGGGGMRIRLAHAGCPPQRVALRFSIPCDMGGKSAARRRDFDVHGCVLRATTYGRQADHVELAVKFQRLSVEDGLALSAFLCE